MYTRKETFLINLIVLFNQKHLKFTKFERVSLIREPSEISETT